MSTDPQANRQLEEVVMAFFPSCPKFKGQVFGTGHIHHTFLIQVENGQSYLLQKMNTSVFQKPQLVMDNIERVTHHLMHSNYPLQVATPLSTPGGKFLVKDQEQNHWRLFPFLANTRSFDQVVYPERAYSAARAFGQFTKSMVSLSIDQLRTSIPHFHNCAFRGQQLERAIREDPCKRLTIVRREVRFLQELSFCKDWQKIQLPKRISHNDTKINNVLFDAEGKNPVAIIDLDTVMPASPLYDFGDMVRTFTNAALEDEADDRAIMRLPFFDALCRGYASTTRDILSPVEREALLLSALVIVQVQAQRFLCDFLLGDIYYKIKFPKHNLMRCRNQIALLRSMVKQHSDMKVILRQQFA